MFEYVWICFAIIINFYINFVNLKRYKYVKIIIISKVLCVFLKIYI